jgi:hypothetical protein
MGNAEWKSQTLILLYLKKALGWKMKVTDIAFEARDMTAL